MKYEVSRRDDGRVNLQLGLNHGVDFDPDCNIEEVAIGVTTLIERVTGVSSFEMIMAVAQEMGITEQNG